MKSRAVANIVSVSSIPAVLRIFKYSLDQTEREWCYSTVPGVFMQVGTECISSPHVSDLISRWESLDPSFSRIWLFHETWVGETGRANPWTLIWHAQTPEWELKPLLWAKRNRGDTIIKSFGEKSTICGQISRLRYFTSRVHCPVTDTLILYSPKQHGQTFKYVPLLLTGPGNSLISMLTL